MLFVENLFEFSSKTSCFTEQQFTKRYNFHTSFVSKFIFEIFKVSIYLSIMSLGTSRSTIEIE